MRPRRTGCYIAPMITGPLIAEIARFGEPARAMMLSALLLAGRLSVDLADSLITREYIVVGDEAAEITQADARSRLDGEDEARRRGDRHAGGEARLPGDVRHRRARGDRDRNERSIVRFGIHHSSWLDGEVDGYESRGDRRDVPPGALGRRG